MVTIDDFNVSQEYPEDNGPYPLWVNGVRYRLVFFFCTNTWRIITISANHKIAEATTLERIIEVFNTYLTNGESNID